jgi:hypothetical protein
MSDAVLGTAAAIMATVVTLLVTLILEDEGSDE